MGRILSFTASGYFCSILIERDGNTLLSVLVGAEGGGRERKISCSDKLKSSKMRILPVGSSV